MSYMLDSRGFVKVEFETNSIPPQLGHQLGPFIYKVLKQVHPGLGISKHAMDDVESLVQHIFSKIAEEASRLARYDKRCTIGEKEIKTAVRTILPAELAKHAILEGDKAISRYNEN